jgi:hypothetical protein
VLISNYLADLVHLASEAFCYGFYQLKAPIVNNSQQEFGRGLRCDKPALMGHCPRLRSGTETLRINRPLLRSAQVDFSRPPRAFTERSRGAHHLRCDRSPSAVEGRSPFDACLTPGPSPKGEWSRAGVADNGTPAAS